MTRVLFFAYLVYNNLFRNIMSDFYPITELDSMEIPRINWNLQLPDYAPAHKIGVNVVALSRLARLGGYETLSISGGDLGVAKINPSVDGLNADGSSTLSGASSVAATESMVNGLQNEGANHSCDNTLHEFDTFHWRRGNLVLNTQDMSHRLSQEKGGALRSEAAWSREINDVMKSGMTKAAKESLIDSVDPRALIYTGFMLSILNGYDYASDGVSVIDVVRNYALIQLGWSNLSAVRSHNVLKERRWSAIAAYQFDRLAVVAGLSKMTRLVKPLS